MAMARFSASRTDAGPRLMTVTLPPCCSLSCSAASMACRSKVLMTGCTPSGGTTRFAASSTLNWLVGISGSGTCLMQTTISISTPRGALQPLGHELLQELHVVDHLIVAAEGAVLRAHRVEAVRARRDDLPHLVAVERLDVLLRLELEQVLVADAPHGVAAAGLLGAQDRERDGRALQQPRQRDTHLDVALVVGAGAADPEQVLGVRPLGERGDA